MGFWIGREIGGDLGTEEVIKVQTKPNSTSEIRLFNAIWEYFTQKEPFVCKRARLAFLGGTSLMHQK